MKEYLKGIPITTFVVTYFFICGGLYLIGFWQTFNIEVYQFVQLWDIPKSFIFPFSITFGSIFMWMLIDYLLMPLRRPAKLSYESEYREMRRKLPPKLGFLVGRHIGTLLFLVPIIPLYFYQNGSKLYWLYSCLVILGIIITEIELSGVFISLIPNPKIRLYLTTFFIMNIGVSFLVGKFKALDIYNNSEIMYIHTTNKTIDSTILYNKSMKSIGFLGDKFIISTLDNKKILILNQSVSDAIILSKDVDNASKTK